MHLYEPFYPHRNIHIPASLVWKILLLLGLLLAAPFLAGCRHHEPALAAAVSVTLSSTALRDGKVPREFTCDGEDKSPPLAWTAPPVGTRSLALTVTDPDAPGSTFPHWVLFNLPPNTTTLPASVAKQPELAGGGLQGRNDFGRTGYNGPCPPPGKPHHYVFTLYALDTELANVAPGATRAQVESAMQGHLLGKGELTATYSR